MFYGRGNSPIGSANSDYAFYIFVENRWTDALDSVHVRKVEAWIADLQ